MFKNKNKTEHPSFFGSSVYLTISVNIDFGNSVAQRLCPVPFQILLAPAGSLEICGSTMSSVPYLSAPYGPETLLYLVLWCDGLLFKHLKQFPVV